jgi:hypothetical protein
MPGLQTGNLPTRPWRRTVDQIPEAMNPSARQGADRKVALLGDGGAKPWINWTIAREFRWVTEATGSDCRAGSSCRPATPAERVEKQWKLIWHRETKASRVW